MYITDMLKEMVLKTKSCGVDTSKYCWFVPVTKYNVLLEAAFSEIYFKEESGIKEAYLLGYKIITRDDIPNDDIYFTEIGEYSK